ncbi:MAG: RtcB family protein [Gemmatimonadota bacterium]
MARALHGKRAPSPTEARRRISARDFRRQMKGVWFDPAREPQLRDEAPAAYKDVEAVMRAQRDLTRVVRRLRPLLVHKG